MNSLSPVERVIAKWYCQTVLRGGGTFEDFLGQIRDLQAELARTEMGPEDRWNRSQIDLKALDCPKELLEALDIWWMVRGHEITKLRNWTARANGQGVIDAETTTKALPEGKS